MPSGHFVGRRAERFSAEPLFREAKWNPYSSATIVNAPARGVFHCQENRDL